MQIISIQISKITTPHEPAEPVEGLCGLRGSTRQGRRVEYQKVELSWFGLGCGRRGVRFVDRQ